MFALLIHYLEHPLFWLLHIALFIYAYIRLNSTSNSLENDRVIIEAIKKLGTNILVDFHSHPIDEHLKKQPIYTRLLVVYPLLQKSKQEQLFKMVDDYEAENEASIDWLDRITNIFLLSGIVGTLFGLFSSSLSLEGIEGAMNKGVDQAMKSAFSAFGVTIFAVIFSVILHMREINIRTKIQDNIISLKTIFIPLLSYEPPTVPIEERPEYEVQKLIMLELGDTLEKLQKSLESPDNMMSTFVELKDLIQHIASNLDKSSTALDAYSDHIEDLPQKTDHSFRIILSSFEEALKKMETNIANNMHNASSVLQHQRSHLEDLDKKTQALNQEALKQLSENVRISREFFTSLGKDYEEKLNNMLLSSNAQVDKLSVLFFDLTKKFDAFANHLESAATSMLYFVEKTTNLNQHVQIIQEPFTHVEKSISVLSSQMNKFFENMQYKMQENQEAYFGNVQRGINKNIWLIAILSLGISVGTAYLQRSNTFMGNSKLEMKKEIQIEIMKDLNVLQSQEKNNDQQPEQLSAQSLQRTEISIPSCDLVQKFVKEDTPKLLPNFYKNISNNPKNKPYQNICISKEEMDELKKFDKASKKFYVHLYYQTQSDWTCHLPLNKDPSDFLNLMRNEFELKANQVIKDSNEFTVKINCH